MLRGPIYEDINYGFEYMDVSRRKLGVSGIVRILGDVGDDGMIKHANLSYNLTADEMLKPSNPPEIIRAIGAAFRKNKQAIALDFAGNHLFENSQHPTNEHLENYVLTFTDMLSRTALKRLDLSDNCIAGPTGRMLKGLGILMRYMLKKGEAISLRFSHLSTQGFRSVSDGLGVFSPMKYLDISDNRGGQDPSGKPNSEGVIALMTQVSQSLKLNTLKVARNFLREDDVIVILEQVSNMPQLQVLDISGNDCHTLGALAAKDFLCAHSLFDQPGLGVRELYLSNNPIGDEGVIHIGEGIRRTGTLALLHVAGCDFTDEGMKTLQEALAANGTIVDVDVARNPASKLSLAKAEAEVEAMRYVVTLRTTPDEVDANALTNYVYIAVTKKLRFLTSKQLRRLYKNASFVEPNSEMCESLHQLEPPGRRLLLADVKVRDQKMDQRMEMSMGLEKKLIFAKKIHRRVMAWYKQIQYRNNIAKALQEAEAKLAKQNAHNAEDDIFAKYA